MKNQNNDILIKDWAGNELFIGPYNDPKVDEILALNDPDEIFLSWIDPERTDNIYELI